MLRENLHRPGISIHALRKESDFCPPVFSMSYRISIHALRKESDQGAPRIGALPRHFNPRSP